ncbi:transketolase family protein, partial [Planctomycetota bacterium]|nr:transketolase family protein [Planctomycetota bacterium]
ALLELGASNPDVVVLDADLSGSTKTKAFGKAHPDRFFNMGVAEANMIGVAAGLASQGKVAFASSFAMFATGKAFEQIRQSVCVPELNVKICATHAGLTVGEDGKSHQMLEDVTIMRVIPGMQVIVPADAVEARQAVLAAAEIPGPVYVRLSRASTPIVFSEDYRFEFGKAAMLRDGGDLAIVAMGVTVAAAIEAADMLSGMGIEARVLNMSTISPMDSDAIESAARDCGAILTAEEHQENGGLGDAVAQAVVRTHPVPMEMCGMNGSFGQSGTGDELLAHYGLDAAGLVARAQQLLKRKQA